MPQAPAGLEAIVAKNQAVHKQQKEQAEALPEQAKLQDETSAADPAAAENDGGEAAEEGLRQTQKMRPPQPTNNMLNQEMAEAAAKEFKKKEKKIQKACAKLDDPDSAKATCSCIIM